MKSVIVVRKNRDNCFIYQGQIYYISNQIFTFSLNEYEITSIKGVIIYHLLLTW